MPALGHRRPQSELDVILILPRAPAKMIKLVLGLVFTFGFGKSMA